MNPPPLLLGAIFASLAVLAPGADTPFYHVTVGPAATVMQGGVFPYLFRTREGTMILEGSLMRPPGVKPRPGNDYGAIPQIVRSTDGGLSWTTWAPPGDPLDGPICEGAWIQLRSGPILMFQWTSDLVREGLFVGKRWQSNDDWRTVLPPEKSHWVIPGGIGGGTGDDGSPFEAVQLHRTVLEMPNGDLTTALYGWMKGDRTPSEYLKTMYRFRCMYLRSRDQGRHWSLVSTIAYDPIIGQEGFNESSLVRLAGGKHPGRLICLMRVGRRTPIYQCVSDDDGATWSPARALNLVGVDPDLIELSDGTLACSFGHKPECHDDGNFIAFSFDQGEDWSQIARVSTGPTGAYTTVCELRPGLLYIVYDVREGGYHSLPRRIVGRRVSLSAASPLR